MENFFFGDVKLKETSPLTFAFVGDCVYELLARSYITGKGNCPVKKLHQRTVKLVNAHAQSVALEEVLMPVLTEEEADIVKRGRNAHVVSVPKNADLAEYHNATALEMLFGYLYLAKRTGRIRELFDKIVEQIESTER